MSDIPDQQQRDEIAMERERNVVVTAGAGTGKTYTLVTRIINLIAPEDEKNEPLELHRIAAITFTRRAAGDLKLQVRRRLLEALAEAPEETPRAERLSTALAQVDGAYIGTIHGFCRRLLLARPMETGLGPDVEVQDDPEDLIRDTHRLLLSHVQTETLEEVVPVELKERAIEAQGTLLACLDAGLLAESRRRGRYTDVGLDRLLADMIDKRDALVDPDPPALSKTALKGLRKVVGELKQAVTKMKAGRGQWAVDALRGFAGELAIIESSTDESEIFKALIRAFAQISRLPRTKKSGAYPEDDLAWQLVKALRNSPLKKTRQPVALRELGEELTAEVFQCTAARLIRIAPVVLELYERVKRQARVVDQTDLLIKLRDALRDNLGFRSSCQKLFDHILLDECQDTDPLQMEMVSYLAEESVKASHWQEVELRDGFLTVVGDKKQSIYGFRRADIRAYEQFLSLLKKGNPLIRSLSCNFRSRRELVQGAFNQTGRALLGDPEDNNKSVGRAPYESLEHFEDIPPADGPAVLCLLYGPDERTNVDPLRREEGEVIARYLDSLLDGREKPMVRYSSDHREVRPLRPEDVAILCRKTTNLSFLTRALDRHDIPYVQRGGSNALSDPLIARFFLALRTVSDPGDGPAQAAFFSAPFFALNLADMMAKHQERKAGERIALAQSLLDELKAKRHTRSLSETALELIEKTGFGAYLAVSPNGRQRLDVLHQAIAFLQEQADVEGLDFDGATARGRSWAEAPPRFDPAESDHAEAVRIFTTHQSKGLEFPVVVLWDATSSRSAGGDSSALLLGRDKKSWRINLAGLEAHSVHGDPAVEQGQLELFEEDRLYYVATTRARDFLIVPKARCKSGETYYHHTLTDGLSAEIMQTVEFSPTEEEVLDMKPKICIRTDPAIQQAQEQSLNERSKALSTTRRPRQEPAAPSRRAHHATQETQPADESSQLRRRGLEPEDVGATLDLSSKKDTEERGRHGTGFGSLVHRAMELAVTGLETDEAFEAAYTEWPIKDKQEARADVQRAREALEEAGLLKPGVELLPEYQLGGSQEDQKGSYLLSGQVDLLAVSEDAATILDYKTDRMSEVLKTSRYEQYARQLNLYADMLEQTGMLNGKQLENLKLALLFTETKKLQHVPRKRLRARRGTR